MGDRHTGAGSNPSPADPPPPARDLCAFIDASPSPYHVAATVAAKLEAAGFGAASEARPLPGPGRHYVVRGGTLVAWSAPARPRRFRLLGAHTDSPNLRLKPRPERAQAGLGQVGVEVYGGVLLNSWLDRDLGLSGRVATRSGGHRLLAVDRPWFRIPQLAIHLDREVNERGLVLDRQKHLAPLWASTAVLEERAGGPPGGERGLRAAVAAELQTADYDIVAWDLMLHPVEPARLVGLAEEFVSAPRIDNQLSCWAGTCALIGARAVDDTAYVLALFDHEEVGSTSDRGAAGAFLASVLERVALGCGLDRAAYLTAVAGSICASVDCAHATHPNYADRHEPAHAVDLNGGPVLKLNSNVRYATESATAQPLIEACERAGVPYQWFVTRSDLPCGSTIGPLTAAALGLPTVDVGASQLAMHSARELCGAQDPSLLRAALAAFLEG
jgi:aspartyl aminopeptidase